MSEPENWCPDPPEPPSNPPPEPGSAPNLRPGLISQLCAYGWRPHLITGYLRDYFIRQFGSESQIEEPILKQYVWKDGTDTGILIESIHRWVGDIVSKRPAIIIKRNSYQSMQLGIGNQLGVDERGQKTFSKLWVGSHTAFCIHGSGAAVELLSCEVARSLTEFAFDVQREFGLHKWSVTEVGAISELEESKEAFVIPVTIGWAYEHSWKVELESPKLRQISLQILLGLEPFGQ